MPKMGVTMRATHLGPHHPMGNISNFFNCRLYLRLVIAWPTTTGIKFGFGQKEGGAATDA